MPCSDAIHIKFGEASEAAQLLETELGTLALMDGIAEKNLIDEPNPKLASDILKAINRQTLSQLIKSTAGTPASLDHLEPLLSQALAERNRLSHSFFRQHNHRINSEEGRLLMMSDLKSIHNTIFSAYKALMKIFGYDFDSLALNELPTRHLPID